MVYATSHQKVYFFTLQRFSTNFDLDDQKSFALYQNILISDTSVSTNLILNHEGMIVDRILLNICREILVWRGYLPLVFLVLRISTRFSCASSLLCCYFSHCSDNIALLGYPSFYVLHAFGTLILPFFFAFRAVWSKLCTHCLYVSCAIIRVQQLSTSIIPINSYGN